MPHFSFWCQTHTRTHRHIHKRILTRSLTQRSAECPDKKKDTLAATTTIHTKLTCWNAYSYSGGSDTHTHTVCLYACILCVWSLNWKCACMFRYSSLFCRHHQRHTNEYDYTIFFSSFFFHSCCCCCYFLYIVYFVFCRRRRRFSTLKSIYFYI